MITVDVVENSLLQRWVGRQPHASASVVQGPNIPSFAELRVSIDRMIVRLSVFNGWMWVAAASIVGFEGLEIVMLSMLTAPEFIPLVIVALALVAVMRNWWRHRSSSDLRTRNWVR